MNRFFILGLLAFFLFAVKNVNADRIKPPKVVVVNGEIPMYEIAAKMMVADIKIREKNVNTEWGDGSLQITGDTESGLFQSVVRLYNNGQESNFRYGYCNFGKSRSIYGIYLDRRRVISQVMLCEK